MDDVYGGFDWIDLIIIVGCLGMGKMELVINIVNFIGW